VTTVRIASFNIFFFGELGDPPKVERDPGDLQLLARVIDAVDPDVISFQEIFDLHLLQEVLDRASAIRGTRSWTAWSEGRPIATGPTPTSKYQVAMAVDSKVATVGGISMPLVPEPKSRPPLVVDLEVKGRALQVVAVHMKSGLLDEGANGPDSMTRCAECVKLRDWIAGNPVTSRVLIGDFNSLPTHPSTAHLRTLPGWTWPAHRWPQGVRRWTTHLDSFQFDPCAIDHLALAEGLSADALQVHCFDRAEDVARDGVSWRDWCDSDNPTPANLRRVSDHRTVFADVRIA
jgi:endonuclease/exonuclease/phosphatase family metal-dependent hydrolase